MRKLLLAAVATAAIASPAAARDGSGYVGVDLGAMIVENMRYDFEDSDTIVDDGSAGDALAIYAGFNGTSGGGVDPSDVVFSNLGGGNWRISITASGDSVTFASSDISTVNLFDDNGVWAFEWNGSNYGTPEFFG